MIIAYNTASMGAGFRASTSVSHNQFQKPQGFGIVGNILIIIVPLIFWLVFKKLDNEQ